MDWTDFLEKETAKNYNSKITNDDVQNDIPDQTQLLWQHYRRLYTQREKRRIELMNKMKMQHEKEVELHRQYLENKIHEEDLEHQHTMKQLEELEQERKRYRNERLNMTNNYRKENPFDDYFGD